MTDTMKFSDVFDSITYQVKTTLMNANRAEKMYARFERTTEPMDIEDQFHFVYNSRFGPFIRSKLWQMSSHFSYAKSALTDLGDAVNTDNALKATMGTQELKAFKERGDYFIFMYSSVFNGDTYDLIIKSIGHFIRYFSYKLAENAVVIPDYDHFSDKRPEGGEYVPGRQETYVKKNIVNFGSSPSLEQHVLAYEAFLTWTCQMALHFAYMQNDSHDIEGIQGASQKIQALFSTLPFRNITECESSLRLFMLYFYRLHDSPLMAQYGEISGLSPKEHKPHDGQSWKAARILFNGKMVIRPTTRAAINNFWGLHSLNYYQGTPKNHKTQYYRVWWVLTPTYTHLMNRTPDGKALNAINEIFRGEKAALHFMDSQSDHTTVNFQSPNIMVQRARVDPTHAYGLLEQGPTVTYPEEIVRSMTDLHYDPTQGGYAGLGAILDDDSQIHTDIDVFTQDMLSKLATWCYDMYFMNLTPKHNAPNGYTFQGQTWTVPGKTGSTDSTIVYNYDSPTPWLGTATFNCSDYFMGSGYGPLTARGTDMHLINKILPTPARPVYDVMNYDGTILDLKRGEQRFMTVYRTFGKFVYTADHKVDLKPAMEEDWAELGNREASVSILRSE